MENELISPAETMPTSADKARALTDSDVALLIDRIGKGEFMTHLADELAIDKRRLSERLKTHAGYSLAKQDCIESQLDSAQIAVNSANTMTDISRARERFRAAAWRAEHEYPERWGGKLIAVQVNQVSVSADMLASAVDLLRAVNVKASQLTVSDALTD